MNSDPAQPLDLSRVKVLPLAERRSLCRVEDILVDPDGAPPAISEAQLKVVEDCAKAVRAAQARNAAVILIYGAHLLRNGAALILGQMLAKGWITHLATNGAGCIHDWEFAWLGRSTENVEDNVAAGTFGTWDETGRYIHLALFAGALENLGFGESVARFIARDSLTLPDADALEKGIRSDPRHPLAAARADLLEAICRHQLPTGQIRLEHRWKHASIFAHAFNNGVPVTVHPGIGYDIIATHPMHHGAAIGRAGARDFAHFATAVDQLDGGVVLSVGSAIMGPQVFEKSLSCVHNLRLQEGRSVVGDHSIFVVDIQEGGNWDWTEGEPPKDHAAYYLRFCKSYHRMGGAMSYLCCDNLAFVHHLHQQLREKVEA